MKPSYQNIPLQGKVMFWILRLDWHFPIAALMLSILQGPTWLSWTTWIIGWCWVATTSFSAVVFYFISRYFSIHNMNKKIVKNYDPQTYRVKATIHYATGGLFAVSFNWPIMAIMLISSYILADHWANLAKIRMVEVYGEQNDSQE